MSTDTPVGGGGLTSAWSGPPGSHSVRLVIIAFAGWLGAACAPPVKYAQPPEPLHIAVGCWELDSPDADKQVRARLLPGRVIVEFDTEPLAIHYRRGPVRLRTVDFRLRIRAGLEGYLITNWTPISRDSVVFYWSFGAPTLHLVGAFAGDSLAGSGGLSFDVGGCCPFRITGRRVRCSGD